MMGASAQLRWEFEVAWARLVQFAAEQGVPFMVTCRWRSAGEQLRLYQERKTRVQRSRHQDWMAVDIVILDAYHDCVWGHIMGDAYEALGDYWETLHPLARWGGRFGRTTLQPGWDPYHFEFARDDD